MTGTKSRWFVEIFLDGSTIRFSNNTEAVTLGGVSFAPLADRFTPPDKVRLQSNLKSSTIELEFDSSRQLDNTDILGGLLDSSWRRRPIRLRNIHYTTDPNTGDVISDTYGRIRRMPGTRAVGKPAIVTMEIESGSLAYLERRMQTRSAENQKIAFPGDLGFDLVKVLEDVPRIWRTKETKKGDAQPTAAKTDEYRARELPIGEFVTDGSFVAHFTNQFQLKNWMRVFAIGDCQITELNKVWINGELMISAPLVHGVRTEITALNSGGARAWITFHDGRYNQTADAFLVSVEPTWTSAHKLQGVAYAVIEHLYDDDNPLGFDYKFGGKGAKFYDRRKDTTAGGSGSQRLATPSTWAYTKNPMVISDHYRQGIKILPASEPNAGVFWFGVGEAADVTPYAEYLDLANLCDELVATKAGETQKRYEASGIISAADDHKKNLERLAGAMAARAIDTGGRIVFRPVREQVSALTLIDGDLISKSAAEYDPTGRIDDLANTIEGRFQSALNDYKTTDYPRVSNAAYITEDGDTITATANFDLETDGERAQRLALLNLAYLRRVATLKEVFRSSQVRTLEPGDWFTRDSDFLGFDGGKLFEVDKIERKADATTTIDAVEVDPTQQAWVATMAIDLSVPPVVAPLSLAPLTTPSITALPISVVGGGTTLPAVRLTHAAFASFIGDGIEAEFGVSNGLGGGSLGISGNSGFVKFPGTVNVVDVLTGLPPAVTYAMRFRARQGERLSAWSSFLSFTSTGTYDAATSGVASSIIGQGWGATASEANAGNTYVPTGSNSLSDTGFRQPSGYWLTAGAATVSSSVLVSGAGLRALQAVGSGFSVGGALYIRSVPGANSVPVKPGDKVGARALIGGANLSEIDLRIRWFNTSGVSLSVDQFQRTSGILSGVGEANLFTEDSLVAIAPASAASASLEVYGIASSATPRVRAAFPTLAIIPAGQLFAPPLALGMDATRGADITGENSAPSIIGQGALATLNAVGTAQISSGAITNVQGTSVDGPLTLTAHAWTEVAAVPITTIGGAVLIGYNAVPYATTNTTIYPLVQAYLTRDATVIRPAHTTHFPSTNSDGSQQSGGAYSGTEIDNPPAGTYTYRLYMKLTTASGSGALVGRTVESRVIHAMEFKR